MHELWRTEGHGVLSVETNGFRLTVQAPERVGGAVRFMVVRREASDRMETIVGSGSKDSVRAAMAAAERMAESFAASKPLSGAVTTLASDDQS